MSDEEMLKHYSAALDEIYRLRVAAAYEARILANVLDYATLPKRVRNMLQNAHQRHEATACGMVAHGHLTAEQRQTVLQLCNAPMTLTRHEWETQR